MKEMIEVFSECLKTADEFPVDFDAAWQWVGYNQKSDALDMLKRNFQEGEDFDSAKRLNQSKGRGGDRKTIEYRLSTDCFKEFCMIAGTDKGREVRRYFIQAEKLLRKVIEDTRIQKQIRRNLTDALQSSGENERMHGHGYSTYTNMIYYLIIGMDARKFREMHNLPKDENIRPHLSEIELKTVMKYEEIARAMVDAGASYDCVKSSLSNLINKTKLVA